MSLKDIRDRYGVPAKRGGRVYFIYENRHGTIVGTSPGTAHLRVRFDGEKNPVDLHPTWELEYLAAVPPKTVDVARVEAAIKLLYPDDMTPMAKSVLEKILAEAA